MPPLLLRSPPQWLTPRRRWLTGGALVAALALGAWLVEGRGSQAGEAGATATAAIRPFASSVTAIGVVRPQIGAEVRVGSRVSGRVQRLRANIGARVEAGEVVAELEAEALDALIAQRRAELDMAESRLQELEQSLPHEVEQAAAELARAEATAAAAAAEWERYERLLERGVATRAEWDAAQERHLVAASQLEAARTAVRLLNTAKAEQRVQAQAERDRGRAELTSARIERSYTEIRAPIAGIVASVSTQEGETVAAGLNAPTFLTIVDLDRLQVDAYVDEVDIGRVALGQRATFTVDAYPADDFAGRVTAIYPSATVQDNVVKYIVAVTIDGRYAGRLRPEMTASVRIALEEKTALGIPLRAVQREAGRNVVHVVRGRSTEAREVRLGWREGAWVEVLAGLEEGDEVLLDAANGGTQ